MRCFLTVSVIFLFCAGARAATPVSVSALAWPENKRAAWCMSFDDCCESQATNVVPVLLEKRIPATFYCCPGWGFFWAHTNVWSMKSDCIVLGNHTFTHTGGKTPAEFEKQIADCNAAIRRVSADRRWPRLIAFGIPNTDSIHKLLKITDREIDDILSRHHLVVRAPYFGFPEACRQIRGMTTYIDSVIAGGGMGHLDFHGIGGDWLDPGLDYFKALIAKLEKERDKLWLAPFIDIHKYMRLRGESRLLAWKEDDGSLVVEMKTSLDPALYDIPLWVKVDDPCSTSGFVIARVRPGRNELKKDYGFKTGKGHVR